MATNDTAKNRKATATIGPYEVAAHPTLWRLAGWEVEDGGNKAVDGTETSIHTKRLAIALDAGLRGDEALLRAIRLKVEHEERTEIAMLSCSPC